MTLLSPSQTWLPDQTGNNTLIGSLVRLPDNHLHIAESERVLRNEDKYQELIQLYHSKGQHRKGVVCVGGEGGGGDGMGSLTVQWMYLL